MAKQTITTATDRADFFKRLNGTTKRINPVTGERYETPRLRDILTAFVNPPATLSPCPATPPAGSAGAKPFNS